jgi:nucleoside-diphosphate-sugar epimerase
VNVFLAGATGAIGTQVVRILVDHRHRVFAMTRRADRCRQLLQSGAIPVVADALVTPTLELALNATRPDAVIHQLTDLPRGLDPQQMHEAIARNAHLRTVGTVNLVAAAMAAGVRRKAAWRVKARRVEGEQCFVTDDDCGPLVIPEPTIQSAS